MGDQKKPERLSVTDRLKKNKAVRMGYRVANGWQYQRTRPTENIAFFHAFNFLPPSPRETCFIPVIYDLSYKRYPEFHPSERVQLLKALDSLMADVPAVHTISDFSANEIEYFYGIPREKIFVIPPQIKAAQPPHEEEIDKVLKRFELSRGSFLLCVGTLEPRKNMRTLIEAFGALDEDVRSLFPLIVVGGTGWGRKLLPNVTATLVDAGQIRFVDYLPDDDLRAMYASCRVFAYPSVYEGFGMPIAEALSHGANVVASDIPAHHEAGQGLAELVPAEESASWSSALYAALTRWKESDRLNIAAEFRDPGATSAALAMNMYQTIAQKLG
ncbi:glycosyltransferase family 1 protein [Rhizobium sp. NXC24]|uniref:glycosyltransferase family 4 protein n=1 Tax=Rhizobium sp. NXC24 TaxID=2048897 RepID=UPI00131A5D01|nr:glycosyltransferase family 1 protein [Rhizobium sp. NXC24]